MAPKLAIRERCGRCGEVDAVATQKGIKTGHSCSNPVPGPSDPPRTLLWRDAYLVNRDGIATMAPPADAPDDPPKNGTEFEQLAKPLIKWLNENANPHSHIIIDSTSAEVVVGVMATCTTEFLRD